MKRLLLRTILPLWVSLALVSCETLRAQDQPQEEAHHPVVLTRPAVQDVRTSQGYVCQIHSHSHIEVRALERGYLEQIPVKEGQSVKAGQLLFKILPVVYKARLDADKAELELADINLRNTRTLFERQVVSDQELAMTQAERDRAQAKVQLAAAKLGFTNVVAPFDGIIDRQYEQKGSLVDEGDILTTVSDNSLMWVYFNVPEADYLRYKSRPKAIDPDSPELLKLSGASIQLRLANGEIFDQSAGDTVTVESNFDNETGNIQFRADFPNPDNLLRHGQTGTLLINETLKNVLVIPQRATFEILDKQYVFVVGKDGIAHQRVITVSHEMDDIFVIESGLKENERFILEGVRQVHEGEHLKYKVLSPDKALKNLKFHAE
ncbi:MAG: efflux RND transporter periplasmic adaptor subunit [Myxococcales bacterium]|nr:MAG: efflux RND transporter periplasmic adaptor subunit [Myxococcales bacterium]